MKKIRNLLSVSSLAMVAGAYGQTTSIPQTSPQLIPQPISQPAQLPPVMVVSTTPLPGLGVSINDVPAPVQMLSRQTLGRDLSLDVSELLLNRLDGVFVNEMQGNPFQPDINVRGFTSSPLPGTPQGLSVFLDGVRQNLAMGDTVNWDVLPKVALRGVMLMPGSNPLYGLNTLGGALALETKDGLSFSGTRIEALGGSNRRRSLSAEHGGSNDEGLDWYVAGTLFRENGWRDDSPSDVRQGFGKLGWSDARTRVSVSLALADNQLQGNGLQEQSALAQNWASIYTTPDITANRAQQLTLSGRHEVQDGPLLSGNVYFRRLRSHSLNGDINDDSLTQNVYQPNAGELAALTAAGYSGFPASGANASNTPFPYWRCIANALLANDDEDKEPAEKCTGLLTRSQTEQDNHGATLQAEWQQQLAGRDNRLTVGAGLDASRTRFSQMAQLGYVNPDRSVTGVNAWADGISGGHEDGTRYDTAVDLSGRHLTWSLFVSDVLKLNKLLTLTASSRYNHTRIRNTDHRNADTEQSLSGDHTFARLNPALGLTLTPRPGLNLWLGYNEGSRAPSTIELGCANPEVPCKLPNAMASDPPLRQVVTRTLELGGRGRFADHWNWRAGVFRAENHDDILFVADDQAGYGYFRNFGKTRRQGIELGLNGKLLPNLSVQAGYTLLDATYQSTELVNGASNSSNSAAAQGQPGMQGTTTIQAGHRLPMVPRHMLKIALDYQATPAWMVGLSMQAVGHSFARGDENNQHQPDGKYYQGSGYNPGYAVFNLGTQYRANKQWEVFAQVNNLFDRRYSTAAVLAPNAFNGGALVTRPFGANADGDYPLRHGTFLAPGAPRLIWVGARFWLDGGR